MDYDYPCNFSRPVSEQLHGTSSTNFSGANPRASSFSTYSNSSFGSSSSTYDSSSSSSSSLGQNGGNSSSSSGGHLASPQSPAYVSMGFTATNSARDSSKQSALFSTLLSKHPNAKSSVQLESVVPLVPPKHRAAPGIYYDMPKNIPVDPRWQVPSAGQHFNTTETPKFPVAAISTPNLYDRPQLPEKSSAVQTKQSMLSLIGSSSSSNNSPKPHHHHSTLPVIVGASLKAVPGMSHSMQSVAPPHPPLSVNTSAYMSTVLGFKQSSTAKPLPPLPGKPVSASQVSLLKSTPPPPTPAKPFSSSTVSAAATTYYDVLPAKNTAVSTAYKAAAAAAADDDTTNYDVLPAKNTAVRGVDLSHLERQMQAHSLISGNNNSRLNTTAAAAQQ
ncbi:hypothetical protein TYRP_005872 [Tyrophagus putrescentiae]|nr:hypothetical protein TYRP_005872 [Tyrophagus putrescentiae]